MITLFTGTKRRARVRDRVRRAHLALLGPIGVLEKANGTGETSTRSWSRQPFTADTVLEDDGTRKRNVLFHAGARGAVFAREGRSISAWQAVAARTTVFAP
jgi:hypothetical protein